MEFIVRPFLFAVVKEKLLWFFMLVNFFLTSFSLQDTGKDLLDLNNVVPEKEMIDVELYEMLQRDLESLRNALQMKEVIISEKDANVEVCLKILFGALTLSFCIVEKECGTKRMSLNSAWFILPFLQALEKKVEILVHSKRAEGRSAHAERKDYAYQIDDLKRALDAQAETHRRQVLVFDLHSFVDWLEHTNHPTCCHGTELTMDPVIRLLFYWKRLAAHQQHNPI